MMNHRLSAAAALATITASFSLFAVLHGAAWLAEGIALTVLIGLAGTLTRAATVPAAVGATIAVAIASVPLMAGAGWAGLIGGLALVAVVALSLTGNRSARGFAILATYCAFLLVYLNAVFAGAQSYARLIPSPASMTFLWRLPSQASAQFQQSPPIPATRPVDLITVAGIGAVAVIVDYTAVRLRRPALAGLPLLLLFSVPVASNLKGFSLGQSISFALAVAGYLTLLSTDGRQRLRMWGRLVTVRRITGAEDGGGPDTRDLAATGRRVGLAAICLAIAIPIALPSSRPHDIFSTDGGSGGSGGTGPGGSASPLSGLQRDLTESKPQPVLSYTTNAPQPQEQYLGQYVMNYDQGSQSWVQAGSGQVRQIMNAKVPYLVPGLQAGSYTTVTTRLNIDSWVTDTSDTGLPVPYAPVRITGNAKQISAEQGTLVITDDQAQGNVRLTVTSDVSDPTAGELDTDDQTVASSIQTAYGSYKGPDATQLRSLAYKHTGGATTAFQDAVDLQDWFHSSAFSYSLRPNLAGGNGWLLQWLTKGRRGFCEQFAVAFAVLAKTLGIPARVVVGFTAGRQSANGTWQVTTADAHAWPELFFPGYGWVRFEPTPGGRGGQGTAEAPAYTTHVHFAAPAPAPSSSTGAPGPTPSAKITSSPTKGCHLAARLCIHPNLGGGTGLNPVSHGFPVGIPIAIVAVLLLASPALGRSLTRRRRWMAASSDAALALAAWRELHDDLTDYGIATLPSDSPRVTVVRVAEAARLKPAPRQALGRIASAVERASYSLGTLPGARLRADVAAVRKALASNATKPQRLRALLLPPSTLAAVGNALQSAGRATSWIDWSWPTMRQQFRRLMPHRAS